MRRFVRRCLNCSLLTAAAIDLLLLVAAVYVAVHTWHNPQGWVRDVLSTDARYRRTDAFAAETGLFMWQTQWVAWEVRGDRGEYPGLGQQAIWVGPAPKEPVWHYDQTVAGLALAQLPPEGGRSGYRLIEVPLWFIVLVLLPLPTVAATGALRWLKQWRRSRPHSKVGFEPVKVMGHERWGGRLHEPRPLD